MNTESVLNIPEFSFQKRLKSGRLAKLVSGFCLLLLLTDTYAQFQSGHRLRLSASYTAGLPVGPKLSDMEEGLLNFYNNFPNFSGLQVEVHHTLGDIRIIPGLYFRQSGFKNWSSKDIPTMYAGSSGSLRVFGASFLAPLNRNGEVDLFSVQRIGVGKIQNERHGMILPLYEDYQLQYDEDISTINLSLGLLMEAPFHDRILFYGGPSVDLYTLQGDTYSQSVIFLVNFSIGIKFYSLRPKKLY